MLSLLGRGLAREIVLKERREMTERKRESILGRRIVGDGWLVKEFCGVTIELIVVKQSSLRAGKVASP